MSIWSRINVQNCLIGKTLAKKCMFSTTFNFRKKVFYFVMYCRKWSCGQRLIYLACICQIYVVEPVFNFSPAVNGHLSRGSHQNTKYGFQSFTYAPNISHSIVILRALLQDRRTAYQIMPLKKTMNFLDSNAMIFNIKERPFTTSEFWMLIVFHISVLLESNTSVRTVIFKNWLP